MTHALLRTLAALFLVAALTVPLSGCIPMALGYLVAKSMEEPKVVTTTCTTPVEGKQQVCTTVSK